MNIDFKLLKNSVGKRLRFEVSVGLDNKETFTDIFYATLREVGSDFIIVEHYYLKSDENFNQELVSQKRKLVKNKFTLSPEIPLNT